MNRKKNDKNIELENLSIKHKLNNDDKRKMNWNEILNKEKFKSKYLFARNYKKRNEEVGKKKESGS